VGGIEQIFLGGVMGAEWVEAVVDGSQQPYEQERNQFVLHIREERPLKMVCLGGGTGLPMVLKGLAKRAQGKSGSAALEITAVVAMSDDGGSSGRLRRTRGMLPPGDIRNCLVALSSGEGPLSELFQYRFAGNKGLAGHAVGNLLIAALTEKKGDFLEAVRLSGQLLNACGTVLPSTTSEVQLVAQLEGDRQVVGERNLAKSKGRIQRVALSPRLPPPSEGILEAIADADLITFGPGSLYSSVLPNLLVDGVAQALRQTRALKVLVGNLMTQPGETDGMSGPEHIQAIVEHAGHVLDAVLVNATPLSPQIVARYERKGGVPVDWDRDELIGLGVVPVEADLLRGGVKIRHDGHKLSRALIKLARQGL
jgi:uncharacterized cofD-like protein